MSLRLVKRLLQQTDDIDTKDENDTRDGDIRKRRRKQHKAERTPVGEEEVVKHQIESMLLFDNKMASKDNKKTLTSARMRQMLGQQKTDQVNAKKVIGNSRGTSSTLKAKQVPTFNKKRYRKQQEEKRLARIAKLLKKTSSTTKKGKK
mmetsp:Transcript_96069/g.277452  ORF Transcript_96069/g.277452 Transcript_96069/m.277452 type:complete len:148 (+) Transcript_96069:47-490(+)